MSTMPTAEQIADLRSDFGDSQSTMFTDAEIQRVWYRVRSASNESLQHEASLALMARSAMGNAAKLHDYVQGNSSEKLSQVFDNLRRLYLMYEPALTQALGVNPDVALGVLSGVAPSEPPTDENGNQNGYWLNKPPTSHGGTEFV